MKKLVIMIALALAVGGCGKADTSKDGSDASPSKSASTEPVAAPISLETTCDLIFASGKNALMRRATDWVSGDDSISEAQAEKISDDLKSLRLIAPRAPKQLGQNITAWVNEVQRLLDDAYAGNATGTFDTTAFRAPSLEIAHTCS